ncbi:MAG: bifunctional methylenetetrahydrofolate dehydrogenase/methenyltetrahydrofolate cyclohydrolase FolD [Clostridia bacterium]|nr:bifunctional methylenetetrahydrofolate dehydrogenase/methenyltetrahydrofolate cyclohydrolase FolD [Clostridia bacterium]
MTAVMLDGKAISAKVKESVKAEIADFIEKTGKSVTLAVIRVGDNPASEIYVRNKIRACEAVGIRSLSITLAGDTSENEVLDKIQSLAADKSVNGILVQLPLPAHINENKILLAIPKEKDVDGFHPENVGDLVLGNPAITACTPSGVIEMIASTGISLCGKHAVVLGRSNIVGKPMALLLLQQNATVTVCHSKTQNLSEITAQADVLIAAIGKPNFVKKEMVKQGAIVVDVGINRTENGIVGDVDPAVQEVASYLSPVPGGVGPMTIAMLMKNTLIAARRQCE